MKSSATVRLLPVRSRQHRGRIASWVAGTLTSVVLASCASTTTAIPPSQMTRFQYGAISVLQAHYCCAVGEPITVSYVNSREGPQLAVLQVGGVQAVLRVAPSGSGARYADMDEQRGLLWASKGDMGMLSLQPPNRIGGEELISGECKVAQP